MFNLKTWSEMYEILKAEYKKAGNLADYTDKDAALISQAYFAIRNLVYLDKFDLTD